MTKISSKSKVVALDLGTSGAKVNDGKKKFIVEALVSAGPLLEQPNGVFETQGSRRSLDNIALDTPLGIRYVGTLAKQSETPPWFGTGLDKYSWQDFMQSMLWASLSEANVNDGDDIIIVTAVPAQWSKNEEIKSMITSHFAGQHTIKRLKRSGRSSEKQINVSEVLVRSEPGGLFYSHILDEAGNPRLKDYSDLMTIAVDIGELSTCVVLFSGLSVRDEKTYTDISMGSVAQVARNWVYEEIGREVETWQVRDIMRSGDGTLAYGSKGAVKYLDIAPTFNNALYDAQNRLRAIVSQMVRNSGNIDFILIGGGGSKPIGQVLKSYQQVEILGQFATVQGLYNYGVRYVNHSK